MSMRSTDDQAWRDYNGPLWAAIDDIAQFCATLEVLPPADFDEQLFLARSFYVAPAPNIEMSHNPL
jgi:hypothetical protein